MKNLSQPHQQADRARAPPPGSVLHCLPIQYQNAVSTKGPRLSLVTRVTSAFLSLSVLSCAVGFPSHPRRLGRTSETGKTS